MINLIKKYYGITLNERELELYLALNTTIERNKKLELALRTALDYHLPPIVRKQIEELLNGN